MQAEMKPLESLSALVTDSLRLGEVEALGTARDSVSSGVAMPSWMVDPLRPASPASLQAAAACFNSLDDALRSWLHDEKKLEQMSLAVELAGSLDQAWLAAARDWPTIQPGSQAARLVTSASPLLLQSLPAALRSVAGVIRAQPDAQGAAAAADRLPASLASSSQAAATLLSLGDPGQAALQACVRDLRAASSVVPAGSPGG